MVVLPGDARGDPGRGYEPGPERVCRIPKASGRGWRPLVLQSIFDRVVQRAVVEVLQPLVDPLFAPFSFGYRPGRGPLRALATAAHLRRSRGLDTWVSVDIRDAFTNVPIGRLLGVIRRYLPDRELVAFLESVIRSSKVRGLRQGGPASPMFLNLFLHHLLDRPWLSHHPDIPLLRFADDVLLLCRSTDQARDAYRSLVTLLRPTGLQLKESEHEAVRDLAAGEPATWMGYRIRAGDDCLRFGITPAAWDSLAEKFLIANEKPNSPLAACAALIGWIGDKAPCYPSVEIDRAYDRIERLAADEGFEEILDRHEVREYWQLAYARWCKLQQQVAASFPVG